MIKNLLFTKSRRPFAFLVSCLSITLYAKEPPFSLESVDFPVQIRSLHFHPNASELLVGGYRNSYIWDLKQRKIKYLLPAPLCQAKAVEFSPQGRYLLASSRHCQSMGKQNLPIDRRDNIQLWDLKQKDNKVLFLGKHSGELKLIQIGPRERYLISVAQDRTVKLWSLLEKKLLYTLRIPRDSQESLALLPYALDYSLKTLAIQNWQDYYMLLYKLPPPPQNKQKLKKKSQSLVKGLQLLHRTEYPFAKPQELFSFAPSQKLYFDGLRIRQNKDGKIHSILKYPPGSNPQKAIFNPQGSVLAILTERKKQNFKTKGKQSFQIELYKFSKTKGLSHLDSFGLASRVKAQSLTFHPNGRILGLADEQRKLHFFSIP